MSIHNDPPGWDEVRLHPDGEPEFMDRDRQGLTMRQWAELRHTRPGYAEVATYTAPNGTKVVTAWVGQRVTISTGCGKIFETAIVQPDGTGETFCQAATEDEALIGHSAAVAQTRARYLTAGNDDDDRG